MTEPRLVYKLTDKGSRTRNACQWGEGVTHETDGSSELCTEGWLHFCSHPLIAVAMNPIYGNFDLTTAKMWECRAEGKFKDDNGLKGGCTRLTTIREVPLPTLTTAQRVRFAILCAMEAGADRASPAWGEWARKWLSGEDGSKSRGRAIQASLAVQPSRATQAAEWAATWAALAAARIPVLSLCSAAELAEESAASVEFAARTKDLPLLELLHQAIAEEPSD